MKTVRAHLNDLKEPERTAALYYMDATQSMKTTEHPETAMFIAFDWSETREGVDFWDHISTNLINDTYFDAPQLTPEKCEAKAKEIYKALPTDAAERKQYPIYSGFMCYFPHAIAAVANLSYKGNIQHHDGEDLHWDMDKSQDELDAMMRHTIDGVTATTAEQEIDEAKRKAWRAMADLERKLTGKCQYTNSK